VRATMRRAFAVAVLVGLPALAGADSAQDAEAFFNQGLVHLREGRAEMALDQFKKAVRIDEKNPYALKGLGLAYMQMHKYDDAVAALRKALVINPYYVDVHNDLGTALMLSGKRAEGKAEFQSAFNDATNPTPEKSAGNLGQAYFEEKNFVEAANWFRTAVNRNKLYVDGYLGLADALTRLGNTEETIAYLQSGAKEVPASGPIQLALCQALSGAGRLAEARKSCEEAARRDPVGPSGRRAVELLKTFQAAR
jgi:tetratricopeptide (TPR) repeat protein